VCPLCRHAVLPKPKSCDGESALVGMKEYIEESLGHDCFLQGRDTNDEPKDRDVGDDRDSRGGDSHKGRKPTTLGWFLLLNLTWTTLEN
jgi:hypothetical protein